MGALKQGKAAPAEDFAGRLSEAMGELKPADLAKICGISRPAVGRWFSGGGITPVHLFKVSRHLNVNPEWLGTGIGKRQRAPQCVHDDIPERDIELIRAFGKLSTELQKHIRNLVGTLPEGGP